MGTDDTNQYGDYSDQSGDYSKEYNDNFGETYPQGYENQYRESDADYASAHLHKRGKNAHNKRQNASDADWTRWEADVDAGGSSKETADAVNQRREGQDKVAAAAVDMNSPHHRKLNEDKTDCLHSVKDCAGVCWGGSTLDSEGGCCLEDQKDCAGVCFGDSIWLNKNFPQYGSVALTSSLQSDWKCCSRSKDSSCCQNQQCSGGCPEEGSGGKVVYQDGEMCVCDPKKDKGCCSDGYKDCRNRCPNEENYGDGCARYEIYCDNEGSSIMGVECKPSSNGGANFVTELDCYWWVGSQANKGNNVLCIPQ